MSPDDRAYEASGVVYEVLDAAKRAAQRAAVLTSQNAVRRGSAVDDDSRGEPATVLRVGNLNLGFVLECLGTKSMIARAYEAESSIDLFDAIGYDTVASAVNDCCCVGALPIVVNAYFATGASSFYEGTRHDSLVAGFKRACDDAGASWGGGESPTLSGLIATSEIDLAASAVGIVPDGTEPIYGDALEDGDAIIFVSSNGLHANGASLARSVATTLKDGLMTRLPSGRSFGDALLDETVIYVALVEAILNKKLALHYASHITGHGLRKVMRANRDLSYRIESLPNAPEVLSFLVEKSAMSEKDAYGTLNMGVGFALYVPPAAATDVLSLADELGYRVEISGHVESGPRRVLLEPVGVTFDEEELRLR